MHDTALYQDLLGLPSPWTVSRVHLDIKGQRVDVCAEHPEDAAWACPHGTKTLPRYDHAEERTWRHLDSGQFQPHLHARIPRVECGEQGVVQVLVPWAAPRSRFTLLFERLAIDRLSQCDVTGATKLLRISWDEGWGIMARAGTRGRHRNAPKVVRQLGVDEQAAATGPTYLTLGCDLDEGTVEHLAEDRKTESLNGYDKGLSKEQLAGLEAVAMDMWEPDSNATLDHVPDAAGKIVFARFHVMGYVGTAVDTVRKQAHRDLMASGDETLKGRTYRWLYSRENVPDRRRNDFNALKRQELKVGRAGALKEALRRLWHDVYPAAGRTFWKQGYFWATRSRLEPIRKAAETVRRHFGNILTYYQHPVTNARSEGLNSQIQKITRMACGFRNRENCNTAIDFHCGGLELYPC